MQNTVGKPCLGCSAVVLENHHPNLLKDNLLTENVILIITTTNIWNNWNLGHVLYTAKQTGRAFLNNMLRRSAKGIQFMSASLVSLACQAVTTHHRNGHFPDKTLGTFCWQRSSRADTQDLFSCSKRHTSTYLPLRTTLLHGEFGKNVSIVQLENISCHQERKKERQISPHPWLEALCKQYHKQLNIFVLRPFRVPFHCKLWKYEGGVMQCQVLSGCSFLLFLGVGHNCFRLEVRFSINIPTVMSMFLLSPRDRSLYRDPFW